MKFRLLFTFFTILFSSLCSGQTDSGKLCHSFFIEPEILAGKIAPNYEPYPTSSLKETFVLNFGESNIDNKPWAKYYNHPDAGISLAFSRL
ncbi:MAG TPA: hypothetical protein VK809_02015, partial [Bacteroidia bacterium]|nr:hypothetical protein [Bacteroidia bacterium]